MKEREKKYIALWLVMKRECHRLVSRPLYLFCMVIAPLFCYIFFTTLMDSGLPTNMPVGAVDLDNSASSRNILRNLDAFGQTAVVARYSSVNEARTAMQEGKIYGFFYIPKGMSTDAQSQRQPKLSFYTNNSYLIAGSLLFKDMKMMSELASGAAARSVLYAKGATEDQAMGYLQPHCHRYTSDTKSLVKLFGLSMQYACSGSTDVVDIHGNSIFHRCGNQGPHGPGVAATEQQLHLHRIGR